MTEIRVTMVFRGGPLESCISRVVPAPEMLPERSRRFDDGYYVKSRQYTTECFDEIIGLVEYDWITT